ncbi:beta-lactamase hydrolase domain-containing protein [Pseudoxanthomonas suwonensis]|nr:sulfur transferase domain-containing protein [Pseudoxanthomonas suwonensis]
MLAMSFVLAGCAGMAGTRRGAAEGKGDAEVGLVTALVMAAAEDPLSRFASPVDGIRSGGRIGAADLPALQAAGITRVIDLTPDAETPDFDEAAVVRAAGLRYDNLPIGGPGDLDREAVRKFDALLAGVDGPTLVHCASGNRVGALAALRAAWLHGANAEAAIAEGRRWGLTGLEPVVRERLQRELCLARATDAAQCEAGYGENRGQSAISPHSGMPRHGAGRTNRPYQG